MLVNRNRTAIIQRHSGIFQTELVDIGHPSDGKHHRIRGQAFAALHMAHQPCRRLLDPLMLAVENDLDAALSHLVGQMDPHILVKAAQDVGPAIDQRRIDP